MSLRSYILPSNRIELRLFEYLSKLLVTYICPVSLNLSPTERHEGHVGISQL